MTIIKLAIAAGEATHEQIVQYIVAFKEALKPQLLRWERYRGKVCTLRISLNRSAKLTGLQQEAGDRELCAVTYDAILRTPFPPFANEGLYQTFKNAPLDFAP